MLPEVQWPPSRTCYRSAGRRLDSEQSPWKVLRRQVELLSELSLVSREDALGWAPSVWKPCGRRLPQHVPSVPSQGGSCKRELRRLKTDRPREVCLHPRCGLSEGIFRVASSGQTSWTWKHECCPASVDPPSQYPVCESGTETLFLMWSLSDKWLFPYISNYNKSIPSSSLH